MQTHTHTPKDTLHAPADAPVYQQVHAASGLLRCTLSWWTELCRRICLSPAAVNIFLKEEENSKLTQNAHHILEKQSAHALGKTSDNSSQKPGALPVPLPIFIHVPCFEQDAWLDSTPLCTGYCWEFQCLGVSFLPILPLLAFLAGKHSLHQAHSVLTKSTSASAVLAGCS